MPRIVVAAALVTSLALLLPGCTSTASPHPVPSTPSTSAAVGTALEPGAALLGDWSVRGPSIPTGTWLRLGPTGFTIARNGREIFGSWATGDHRLVAAVTGWDGEVADPRSPWLTAAASFQRGGGGGWLLQSDAGSTLAVLNRADHPTGVPKDFTDAEPSPPDGTLRLSTPSPAAIPSDPVRRDRLVGRWVTGAAIGRQTRPAVEFRGDGTYHATDGCNGGDGAWQVIPGSRLLLTAGGHGEVACANLVPVADWLYRTRTIALAGDRLTLYDVAGARIGALSRAD